MAYLRNPYDQFQQPNTPPTPPLLRTPQPMQVAGDPGSGRGGLLNRNEQRMMDELYSPEKPKQNAAPDQVAPDQPPPPPPENRGLFRRALDFVLPKAGAAELDAGGLMPPAPGQIPAQMAGGARPYIGAGSDYPVAPTMPTMPASAGGPQGPVNRAALYEASINAAGGQPDASVRDANRPYDDAAMTRSVLGNVFSHPVDTRDAIMGYPRQGNVWTAPGAPLMPSPGARSAPVMQGIGAAPILPGGDTATRQQPPDGAERLSRESGPMDFSANVVPHYQRGADGALTLTMPGGGSASLLPAPGSRQMQARAGELAGQRLGLGSGYETDAQVQARRPDLYGPDGKPRQADAFGNAVDQGLNRDAAIIDARNAERAAARNDPTRVLLARADDALAAADKATLARTAQQQTSLAGQLYGLAGQANAARMQDATARRGQDMTLAGREQVKPITLRREDGSEMLVNPYTGE